MPVPGFERHGVYHIATRGGHEVSVVIIDDDTDYVEGFRCDVRDIRQNGDPSPRAPVERHNAHVVVADEAVTFTDEVVDLTVYHGRLTDDRAFERVEFPDVEEDPDTRYANLADAYGYEPDVGEREDGANEDTIVEWVRENGEEDEAGYFVLESEFYDEFGDAGQTAIDRGWVEFDEASHTVAVSNGDTDE